MRIGTRILLLMLLITIGSSAIVSWIVTLNVTRYETDRVNDQISLAIGRYVRQLDDHAEQVNHIVQTIIGEPVSRSWLQVADDTGEPAKAAREQLKQEVFGREVQTELASPDERPAFYVLINLSHEIVLVSLPTVDAELERILSSDAVHWATDAVIDTGSRPVMQYVATPSGLFLAMGVPLREQLNEPPTHAYFVGFRIDDQWVSRQLLSGPVGSQSTVAPLAAWFVVDDKVVARASSDPSSSHYKDFGADTVLVPGARTAAAGLDAVEFTVDGERFVGQSFKLNPQNARGGRLVLASSLDRALIPLHQLQQSILLTALVACVIALVACRMIARMIARPIQELVEGTIRVAAGEFDSPVKIRRRDELGTLAESFNQMSHGLKERDSLLAERVKIERDMAVARKIQMDVLPKELPVCAGYDMAAFSLPAEQTGGDIYDLVAIATDSENIGVALLLADATGHGIGPALSVTQVRAMLRIGVRLKADLDEVFAQINRQLCQDLGSDRFVTAFLGLLDPANHSIKYQSAGQGPLLHFHAKDQRFEWMDSSMLPLGILEDPESDGSRRMELERGDLIVLLTDGFFEYHNREKELFGQERVAEVILKHRHLPARELLNELLAATRRFSDGAPQLDDMTGLIIRRLESAE